MFRTFVLCCDRSILRILKWTKKHERQSERITLVSIYNNIFLTTYMVYINTWFFKLSGGKDLQSYTKYVRYLMHKMSILKQQFVILRGATDISWQYEVVYYTTFFILDIVFMSEFQSYSVVTFLKTIYC